MQGPRIAGAAVAFCLFLMAGCNDSGTGPVDAGTHDAGPTLLPAGATCTGNSDCFSGACKTHCCAFSCSNDSSCGVTSCDDTGACVYPSGKPCGTSSCDPSTSQITTSTCTGGICVPGSPQECDAHFGCADASVCNTACTTPADCAAQGYCYDGGCYPMATAGSPCLVDAGCLSGNCGSTVGGPALCCTGACLTADPTCGATNCNGRGDCIYPSNLLPCSIKSCDAGFYTQPAQCDGQGRCPAATGHCAPYACGPNDACATSCASTAGCISGFCDVPSGKCCGNFTGNTIYVDGTAGTTGGCCGMSAGAGACAYLADAVRLAGEYQASGMTVSVASAPKDVLAVQLSYGLVVKAPGIKLPPLRIARFTNDTSTSVTVEGSAGQAVQFANTNVTQITIMDSMTLYFLNAAVVGQSGQTAVQVTSGASLKIGYDGALNSGGVTFDSAGQFQGAGTAISCKGTAAAPATVDDLQAAAGTSLKIQNTNNHLVIGDYCTLTLQDNPVFGLTPPFCSQFGQFFEQRGLQVDGVASVSITNGTFQCFQHEAILMQETTGNGAPTVGGSFNTIQNSGTGVQCNAGTFSMTGTTITANSNGVIQADDTAHGTTGTVDLSGGGNQVYCNAGFAPGADVLNLTASAGLNAQRVAWDSWDADAGATELWSCDATYQNCTCTGAASCSLQGTTPESDADTITINGILVDDKGGSQVAKPCQ